MMDRIYCTLIVLDYKWHRDQKMKTYLDVQSRKVLLKKWNLNSYMRTPASSHSGVTGTGLPSHLN